MARNFVRASSQSIQASSVAANRPTGSQTEACWVYFTTTNNRFDFFANWNGVSSQEGWLLTLLSSGGTLQYFLSQDGSTAKGVDSTFTPSTATWYHVAGTWDGTNQRIYVNGTLKNTATPGIASVHASTEVIGIGQSTEGSPGPSFLNGNLADCAIWTATLTAGEITALANGSRPYMVRPNSLVAYWPLDGLSSPEPDLSGNAKNGTLFVSPVLANGPPMTLYTRKAPSIAQFDAAAATVVWGYQVLDSSELARQSVIAVPYR